MKITVEISDEELKQAILNVMANEYYSSYSSDRNHVDRVTKECVREIIYKDKERISDRIVAQASGHLKNVAIKKMLEKLE